MGSSHSTPTALVKSLLAALGNEKSLLAIPSKAFYEAHDVKRYNLAIPTIPAAVTYPRTVAQVAAIVKAAAAAGLKVQARCGGHSYANYGIGGTSGAIVIDLKHFQNFSMDYKTWRATVGAGTLLGDATKRMHDAGGRAMAHGVCPQVGIGGHATIGGLGPSSRLWGSCLDHIEEVEVVTADGSIKRASEKINSDLFWALKGAGASFGIITEFVCRTEPEPGEAVHFSYSFTVRPYRAMAPMFKKWQAFVSQPELTRKFASELVLTELGMVISGTYFGTEAEYAALKMEKSFPGHQEANTIGFTNWLGLVTHWAETAALRLVGGLSSPFYAKTLTFNGASLIPDKTIDDVLSFLDNTKKGTPAWFVIFDLAGGAVNDVPKDATSYAHRDALFYLQSYGVALDDDDKVSLTLRNFLGNLNKIIKAGMPAGDNFGAYPGYVDPELEDGPAEYWRYNLPRLEQIKREVDPNDVFHNPQSVKPAGMEGKNTFSAKFVQAPKVRGKLTKSRYGRYGRARIRLAKWL